MALKITDECIACDACVESCPTSAIFPDDPIYIINSDICCECFGYKDDYSCQLVCPVEAIIKDDDILETKESLEQKFKKSIKR